MSEDNKSITLFSKEGGSDKVYQLKMCPVDGGYGLIYANGRRCSSLKMKPKTTTPLTLEAATKEFDKIVTSKKKSKSRYVESTDDGVTLEMSEKANIDSGIRLKLLNEITENEANLLCLDPSWVMQPKWDGERRCVVIKDGNVEGTNRYGEYTSSLATNIKSSLEQSVDMVLDSEDMGNYIAVFDCLEYNGVDLRSLPFVDRYEKLSQKITFKDKDGVRLSPIAKTTQEKQAMLQKAIDENQEGVVFIRALAEYIPGRPNSGGNALKYKLYAAASVIVLDHNIKRSVQMAVIDDDGNHVFVGNVTIPTNAEIPEKGRVIEVRYLYAYPNGGSLFQPIFEKPRNDQRISECKQSQLKYKPEPQS